ncbi:hypothetical protein D3C85_1463350 [compost metagenome]
MFAQPDALGPQTFELPANGIEHRTVSVEGSLDPLLRAFLGWTQVQRRTRITVGLAVVIPLGVADCVVGEILYTVLSAGLWRVVRQQYFFRPTRRDHQSGFVEFGQ